MTSSDAGQNGHAPAPPAPELPTTPPPKSSTTAPAATTETPAPTASDTATRQNGTSSEQAEPANPLQVDTEMSGVVPPQEQQSLPQLEQQVQPAADLSQQPDTSHFDMPMPQTPMTSIDQQNAYMAMALAHMASDQMMHINPPSIVTPAHVTPAQVTLPNNDDSTMHASGNFLANSNARPLISRDLASFARIEFADSVFQMTTYAVIIGRDQRAMHQARRDEKRAQQFRMQGEENERLGLPPPSPIRHDRGKFSKSYVSEEGGMLGPESDSDASGPPKKRRKTTSTGSSQKDAAEESQENLISNRQYISHTPGAAAVDLESLRPSPYHVPIIGIHSPGPDIASKTKGISREHLRIEFNEEKGVFEAIPLHRNGFFLEETLHKDDRVVLRSGNQLQIKDVDFRFIINGVKLGKTGAEDDAMEVKGTKKIGGGKEMSFEFEGSHGNGNIAETSSSSSALTPPEPSDDEGSEAEDEDEPTKPSAEPPRMPRTQLPDQPPLVLPPQPQPQPSIELPPELAVKGEPGLEQLLDPSLDPSLLPVIPKKRGPGRPPKNGIMSKREQRLLKKQQQEMAKKTLPQPPPGEPPVKRKVGRPRKHPLPEDGERPEKRKYKPRKPKEEGGEGSDAERRAKEKKDKKVRPKSPPLELKIEDYTEEQLQKPNKNYGVLIDETLTTAHAEGRAEGLTLKQIYKRITLKYPWFYFHTETKGWESSVRHNLIGNEAFKKDETTGLWSRVPGVELDAGKKRKATSPDRSLAAGYGPYGHPMYPNYAGAPHMVPGAQNYQPYAAQPYGGQPAQPGRPQYSPPGAAPVGQPAQHVAPQPVAPAQLPGYGANPMAQTSTYSSPYASRPPPSAAPVKAEDGSVAPNMSQSPAGATPGQQLVSTISQVSPAVTRPNQTPPSQGPPRYVIDPRLFRSVVGLKTGLVENLKRAKNPKAEAIVMSALNRCLGLKTNATENPAMEDICMRGIQKVLDGFSGGQSKSPTPGEAAPKPVPGSVFDARVLNALVGFKNVSSNALKASVGEERAEAVALSAIDRVLGLADATIVPSKPGRDGSPPEPGKPPSHEGLEQRLMGSVKQLLLGLNQKFNTS